MNIAICIMHAAFDPDRKSTLDRLLDRFNDNDRWELLTSDDRLHIESDHDRKGAWPVARACWEHGIATGADWIIVLNDDALPCVGFVGVVRAALQARSPLDPVCFYTAHAKAGDVRGHWYTTHDDLVGVACALSREAAIDFLEWVDANPKVDDFSDDGRLNLWAMARGRKIHTTVPSLVDHQLPNSSTVGTVNVHARRPVVPPTGAERDISWSPQFANSNPYVPHLGRGRAGNHWELLHRSAVVNTELIERAYTVERHGKPVSAKPHVFIAMPAYVTPEMAVRVSAQRICDDLEANGYTASLFETPGDSLVTRGRHCLMHEFLRSSATHMLQWDADIECLDPTAVRRMVETGLDVVGGAYPWRDGSGRVVANPMLTDEERRAGGGSVVVDPQTKTLPVAEVGTGFLLTSRKMIVDLMARHPELMYEADLEPYVGHPMWALFDAHIEMRSHGRRRYASEDWRFCQLARAGGYGVHVYYPPVFRHWGKTPHQGHILKAWGLNREAAT